MEKVCPRCGKVVVVSPEELSMHEGVVVCPQCLAVFDMEGNVKEKVDKTPVRTVAETKSDAGETLSHRYCSECGKPLPGGVKFCPYCGVKIHDASLDEADTDARTAPVEEKAHSQATAVEKTPRRVAVVPTVHYHKHKWGSDPASLRARIVGFTVIAALLALLGFIIYKGLLVSNSVKDIIN